jgi:hypothetical protein
LEEVGHWGMTLKGILGPFLSLSLYFTAAMRQVAVLYYALYHDALPLHGLRKMETLKLSLQISLSSFKLFFLDILSQQ